jgi:hypothetical protein
MMPPKSARKSTSGPGRRLVRKTVRTGEVNGEEWKLEEIRDEKLPDEEMVSSKGAGASASASEKSSGCITLAILFSIPFDL